MLNDLELSRQELERALWEAAAYRRWHGRDPGPPVGDRYAALPVTTPEDLRALGPRAYRAWSTSIAAARSLEPPAPGWNA